VKTECTGRMVFFSRSSLERALTHYVAHYHEERNHQGLQNRLLKCAGRDWVDCSTSIIEKRPEDGIFLTVRGLDMNLRTTGDDRGTMRFSDVVL
jgi:hypothetical protein